MTPLQTIFFVLGIMAATSLAVLLIVWAVKFVGRVRDLEEQSRYIKDEVRLNETAACRAISRLNEIPRTDLPAIQERFSRVDDQAAQMVRHMNKRIEDLEAEVLKLSAPGKPKSKTSKLSN